MKNYCDLSELKIYHKLAKGKIKVLQKSESSSSVMYDESLSSSYSGVDSFLGFSSAGVFD
jgi:hypothetical protein